MFWSESKMPESSFRRETWQPWWTPENCRGSVLQNMQWLSSSPMLELTVGHRIVAYWICEIVCIIFTFWSDVMTKHQIGLAFSREDLVDCVGFDTNHMSRFLVCSFLKVNELNVIFDYPQYEIKEARPRHFQLYGPRTKFPLNWRNPKNNSLLRNINTKEIIINH